MNHTIDLSALPEEVTDYAFDQLPDRLMDDDVIGEGARRSIENTATDYDEQTVSMHASLITYALQRAMSEKIYDIEWEVKHGERDDYTRGDVRHMRATLKELDL